MGIGSLDLEVTESLPAVPGGETLRSAAPRPEVAGATNTVVALVRVHRRPVATVLLAAPDGGLNADAVAGEIWRQAGDAIADHLRADGLPVPSNLGPDGLRSPGEAECLRRRREVLESSPRATVIVATRERPESLRTCIGSLLALDYPWFEIVVVDNDPQTDATAEMVRCEFPGGQVRYVREERRGLAAAHNCGIDAAAGDLLAFTDDDVVVDRDWLAALAEGFTLDEDVVAVTGLIRPMELRTRAQMLLEQHGGFGKGFAPQVFDLSAKGHDDPLYPFTAGQLGSGANMAFDAAALREMGGFDPAMGTGTLARGGDDLLALFSVVASGHRLVYQPGAVVFHQHREATDALGRQAFGYGVGLGAYLANAVIHHPGLALKVARHIPASMRSVMSLRSTRNRKRYDSWPHELARLERKGILLGPAAYIASSYQARSASRPRLTPASGLPS